MVVQVMDMEVPDMAVQHTAFQDMEAQDMVVQVMGVQDMVWDMEICMVQATAPPRPRDIAQHTVAVRDMALQHMVFQATAGEDQVTNSPRIAVCQMEGRLDKQKRKQSYTKEIQISAEICLNTPASYNFNSNSQSIYSSYSNVMCSRVPVDNHG